MQNRKRAPDRKSEIVAALLVLADRIGPDRLTTNDIAREVGVTQAAIFRHFPTKAALWAAAGETLSERLTTSWAAAKNRHAAPQAQLQALIHAQLGQIASCPALPAILHSRELNVDNPALRATVQDILMQFQGELVDALQKMAQSVDMAPELDPKDAAVFLTSLVQGLAIRWSLGARNFDLVAEGMRLFDVQLALFMQSAQVAGMSEG